jgi:hypothetical protein
MKKYICIALVFAFLLNTFSCYMPPPERSSTAQRTYEGAGVGGAVGAVAGALLDRRNPWRGAVIGGALGAVFGGTITEISQRGAMEAARENKTVWYRTEDGRGLYEATPLQTNPRTHCTKVRERVWENNRLVKNTEREVCTSKKTEPGY